MIKKIFLPGFLFIGTVTSSTNLNSKNLALAINNCPVQAITLN